MIYAGLDVHKAQVTFCVLDEAGTVLKRGEVPCRREPITQLAERLGSDAAVALETTTHSHAVTELMKPHVARVVVANPMKVRAIAEARMKTDKVDAEVLAHLLRCDYLPFRQKIVCPVGSRGERASDEPSCGGRRAAVALSKEPFEDLLDYELTLFQERI